MPVDSYMRGDIPLLNSYFPVYLIKIPPLVHLVHNNLGIEANASLEFIFNFTNSVRVTIATQLVRLETKFVDCVKFFF